MDPLSHLFVETEINGKKRPGKTYFKQITLQYVQWSNGQRDCPPIQKSEFESRWSLQFLFCEDV